MKSLRFELSLLDFPKRVMFFCGNIAAGDDGVSWKFFCLIKSYMVAIWPSKELQRSTIIFFWLIIRKNLRAHVIDFYWKMLSNSKWSLHWKIMHLFYESFNKIWIFGSYIMLDTQIWQEKAKTYGRNTLEIRENNE